MLILLAKHLKNLPDKYLICLTVLLLPLSFGVSQKLTQTDNISFQHGQTEFKLGQIKEVAKNSDRKVEELLYQNQQLIESYNQLRQQASQDRRLQPAIEQVDRAIEDTKNSARELADTSGELQELTEEVVEEKSGVRSQESESKTQSMLRRWLTAMRGRNA